VNLVHATALDVLEEIRDAGHERRPTMVAAWAMNLVQSRVRAYPERVRVDAGAGFTHWPQDILGAGSGFCGSQVVAWREILWHLKIRTRELGFSLSNTHTHVGAEAHWSGQWHYFDIQAGAFWIIKNRVLSWEEVRENDPAGRVMNQVWNFGHDYLAYLTDPNLEVEIRV